MSRILTTMLLSLTLSSAGLAQLDVTDSLFSAGDSLLDIFRYQIPEGYDPETPTPLLVGWHQWGGDENQFAYQPTAIEARERGWITLGSWGGHNMNWTNQDTQEWMQQIIELLQQEWNIDPARIYMIGGSMGGASGMIYSNNHLDPTRPMVAASASGSGILDDERRFIEQGNNNSMTEVFGGTWEEVPFTYHRNSAIYFADSLNSMHSNLWHHATYLTYGLNETYHQYHALDLYDVLEPYVDNVYTGAHVNGHGWGVFDVPHVIDWLEQFTLVSDPDSMTISTDEDSRSYWTGVKLTAQEQFGHYSATRCPCGVDGLRYDLNGLRNISEFYLQELDNGNDPHYHLLVVTGDAETEFTLGIIRHHLVIERQARLLLNGDPVWGWADWPQNDTLSLTVSSQDLVELEFSAEATAPELPPVHPHTELELRQTAQGVHLNWQLGPAAVVVYDLLGRELRRIEGAVAPYLLDHQGLASGVYFIRLESGQGIQHGRFIVQH